MKMFCLRPKEYEDNQYFVMAKSARGAINYLRNYFLFKSREAERGSYNKEEYEKKYNDWAWATTELLPGGYTIEEYEEGEICEETL